MEFKEAIEYLKERKGPLVFGFPSKKKNIAKNLQEYMGFEAIEIELPKEISFGKKEIPLYRNQEYPNLTAILYNAKHFKENKKINTELELRDESRIENNYLNNMGLRVFLYSLSNIYSYNCQPGVLCCRPFAIEGEEVKKFSLTDVITDLDNYSNGHYKF